MDKQFKRVTCDPDCGFMVQSHQEKEVIEVTKKHGKMYHKLDSTDEQIRDIMETVNASA